MTHPLDAMMKAAALADHRAQDGPRAADHTDRPTIPENQRGQPLAAQRQLRCQGSRPHRRRDRKCYPVSQFRPRRRG
jgi:hypothetical protein